MKKISSGLILTDGHQFLGCHSTGNYFYDIPKGAIEPGETPLEACVREVWEETGLDVSTNELMDLGMFEYNYEKDLHLFLLILDNLPSVHNMNCCTFFTRNSTGESFPEVDKYRYIRFAEKEIFLTENMRRVVQKIEDNFFSKVY